jgi:hypothetical protein
MSVFPKIEQNAARVADVTEDIREFVRHQQLAADDQEVATNLASLLQQAAGSSVREIDNLMSELEKLREKLQRDGARVQQDLLEYATFTQSTLQSTKVISESLRSRFPIRPK